MQNNQNWQEKVAIVEEQEIPFKTNKKTKQNQQIESEIESEIQEKPIGQFEEQQQAQVQQYVFLTEQEQQEHEATFVTTIRKIFHELPLQVQNSLSKVIPIKGIASKDQTLSITQKLLEIEMHTAQFLFLQEQIIPSYKAQIKYFTELLVKNAGLYDNFDQVPEGIQMESSEKQQKDFQDKDLYYFDKDDIISNDYTYEWEIEACTKKTKIMVYLGDNPDMFMRIQNSLRFNIIGLTSVQFKNFMVYIIELNWEIVKYKNRFMKYLTGVNKRNIDSVLTSGKVLKQISNVYGKDKLFYQVSLLKGIAFSFRYSDQFSQERISFISELEKQYHFKYLLGARLDALGWILFVQFIHEINTIHCNLFHPGYQNIPLIQAYRVYSIAAAAKMFKSYGYKIVNREKHEIPYDNSFLEEDLKETMNYRMFNP